MVVEWEFPSPCGEKVGINKKEDRAYYQARVFPSPCGEKVGINSSKFQNLVPITSKPFPSPCGEKVGIN